MDKNPSPYMETAAIRLAPTKLYCNYCKKLNHSEEDCRNKIKDSKFCEYCKIQGHTFDECGSIRKDLQKGMIVKEMVRTGATAASSRAEAKTAYSAAVARTTDARGHNKSGSRHYEVDKPIQDKREIVKGMKVRVAQMKGQTALVQIRSTKDPGALAIKENDIKIITAVAGTAIATRKKKNGTQEVITGTSMITPNTGRIFIEEMIAFDGRIGISRRMIGTISTITVMATAAYEKERGNNRT